MDGNKKIVRNLGTVCLSAVPFTQVGIASSSGLIAALSPAMVAVLLATVLASLVFIRAINVHVFPVVGRKLARDGQPTPDAVLRSVILAANQKTLPIAVAVLLQLTDAIGPGVALATLACVAAHFMQVILDSLLVTRWKEQDAERASVSVGGPEA